MILQAVAMVLGYTQPAKISYRLMTTTEVRSPVAPSGVLIQNRRRAYEFFALLKPGAAKPLFLKRLNWKRQNVLVVYPGLIQKDARISLQGVYRRDRTVQPYLQIRRGITAETFYPAMLLTIPRQPTGTQVQAVIKPISVVAMRSR